MYEEQSFFVINKVGKVVVRPLRHVGGVVPRKNSFRWGTIPSNVS